MNGNLNEGAFEIVAELALPVAVALPHFKEGRLLKRFQEKCEAVFRQELRNFKELGHFTISM
ncbi:MAG: hypothetical protein ACREEJ_17570, partial [Ensifer adhaerens]